MIFISKLLHPAPLMNSPSSSTCSHLLLVTSSHLDFPGGVMNRLSSPVGVLAPLGAPGVPGLICQNQGPGPRAGECGAACSSRKKPLDLQYSYHIICSLARPPPCAAAPCSLSTVCVPTTQRAKKRPKVNDTMHHKRLYAADARHQALARMPPAPAAESILPTPT